MKPFNDLELRIKYYSALRGVKQYELEQACKCSCSTFERRKRNETMTVADLKAIAKVLRIKPADLLKEVTI